jgi:DNA-binding NtrC family response regulator
VILCDGDTIQPRHLNLSFRQAQQVAAPSPWEQIDLSGTLADVLRRVTMEVERRKIEQALKEASGNRQRAADLLQVAHKVLLQKIKDYGIADG